METSIPKPDVREYKLDGVDVREEQPPDGWCLCDIYRPHTCPWDSYGNSHLAEVARVLRAAGIESIGLHTRERLTAPRGTGPQGRVRFGDDMMPGEYRTAVRKADHAAAVAALDEHKRQVSLWLDGKRDMPQALRH